MLFNTDSKSVELPDTETAIPDRVEPISFSSAHFVSGQTIVEPVPDNLEKSVFGLGCFWGAERLFWELDGVYSTAAGYAGGITANPTYEDVCTGLTGHTEVVLVYFDPAVICYQRLLAAFWESHNPTQGMRQGNDKGTQYRSAIYVANDTQLKEAQQSKKAYQVALDDIRYPFITTEIKNLEQFFYAEDYHQQYLAKNPRGYCGLAGTGVIYELSAANV
jgi:peptide-methionine (S)-S-oxide reductase